MMKELEKNIEKVKKIEYYLRPLTFPVGIKMIKGEEKIPTDGIVKLPDKYNFCQYISMARYDGCHQEIYCVEKDDINCGLARVTMGFDNWPDSFTNGEHFLNVHHNNLKDSAESVTSVPVIPKSEKIKALLVGPLEKMDIEPDVIAFCVIPGQLNRVSEGYQWFSSGGLRIRFSGICGICGWGVAQAYNEKTMAVGIPCQGARRFGHYQDIELFVAISKDIFAKWTDGLEKTFATGHSYPIGIGVIKNPAHAPHYRIIKWPDEIIRSM